MLKKMVTALTLAAVMAFSGLSVSAATIPSTSGSTTITPNQLTISWAGGAKADVVINSFRFYGYNVAQLRTMVNALGGSVAQLADGSYQLSTTGSVAYKDVAFTAQTDIKYILNKTLIRNINGVLVTPAEPGWVLLTDYNYNWASIRDIIGSMGLALDSFVDDPANGTTKVVVSVKDTTAWLAPLAPGNSQSGYAYNYDSNSQATTQPALTTTTNAEPDTSNTTTTAAPEEPTTTTTTTTAAPDNTEKQQKMADLKELTVFVADRLSKADWPTDPVYKPLYDAYDAAVFILFDNADAATVADIQKGYDDLYNALMGI